MMVFFEAMQIAVVSQLNLLHLDYTKTIEVSSNASALGVGYNRWVDDDVHGWANKPEAYSCCSHSARYASRSRFTYWGSYLFRKDGLGDFCFRVSALLSQIADIIEGRSLDTQLVKSLDILSAKGEASVEEATTSSNL